MLRPLRRWTYRFSLEQDRINNWLECVRTAVSRDDQLATEILECSSLLKGYGETHRRGLENFQTLMDHVIQPGLQSAEPTELASTIRSARQQVLASPEPVFLKESLQTNRTEENLKFQV